MSKLKILFTIPNFKTAGSQYVLLSLFRRIDRAVFEPYICVEKFPEMIPDDVPLSHRLVFEWTGKNMSEILNFKSFLNKHKIDIIHSWDYKSNYLEALASKMAGVKYLYTKKNNAWSKSWKLKSFLSKQIAYDNPEMNDRFFNSFIFRNKITFIPHGVDIDIFKPMNKIASEAFNIVCIGNIENNKNQLFIIKTLKGLPENVVLHLYGNEEKAYKERLDHYIDVHSLNHRVHFHGHVENKAIPEIYRKIDLFVLASFQEGLPVSILEAMACGVSVLSSDSGGGTGYLLNAENIFSLENTDELIDKVLGCYNMEDNFREVYIRKGVLEVFKKHTIDMEVLAYEKLYKKLV